MAQALQDIKAKIAAEAKNLRNQVQAPGARSISVKGKVFTFPNGQSTQDPIEVVILDFRNYNRYYTAAYNEQKPEPPACFAINSMIDQMAPHEDVAKPVHDTCVGCPMNQWGSAPRGGKGKACRNTVRLAVIPPDAKADDEALILNVSPTGLRSWSTLVATYEAIQQHPMEYVTKVSFDPNAAYPSLVFASLRPFENLEIAWAIRERSQQALDAPPSAGD